ncbi:MAG: phosphoribosylglycinamide formyltransferase [Vicinamibacterales bacterium]
MSDASGARRLGVLVSGRGSNLQALIDAVAAGGLNATIALVISNVPGVAALDRAAAAGIETKVMPHHVWPAREAYDEALAAAFLERRVHLVCLAGFMRRLSARFLERFGGPVLNVHPSLLPSFPGLDAPGQAVAHGVRTAGCTVHLVTPELDAGPIVAQACVPVSPADTAETLAARILVEEHRLFPRAVATILAGGWRVDGRRFLPAEPPSVAGPARP